MHDVIIATRKIAFRPLDLDHGRSGVGQPCGAERGGHGLFDRDDRDASQGKSAAHQ
jgi:hypothetical protein